MITDALRVDCASCKGANTAFEFQYTYKLASGDKPIRIQRCMVCDAIPCPKCESRTVKVNAKACPDCKTPVKMPASLGLIDVKPGE